MGNYVNYGKKSLETMCLLLAYKIKYPENFFLLRGSHETAARTSQCGFYDECKRRCNLSTWKSFIDCFNYLPLAAVIDEKIFVVHGGLSPDLNSMDQIRRLTRPLDVRCLLVCPLLACQVGLGLKHHVFQDFLDVIFNVNNLLQVPDSGLLCDLLYSNPNKDITGLWAENENYGSDDGSRKDHGPGFAFGPDIVSRFLQKYNMDLIVRGHQVVNDGYEFFAGRKLVTIFSAPNFRGEYDNSGSIMTVDESLLCRFEVCSLYHNIIFSLDSLTAR